MLRGTRCRRARAGVPRKAENVFRKFVWNACRGYKRHIFPGGGGGETIINSEYYNAKLISMLTKNIMAENKINKYWTSGFQRDSSSGQHFCEILGPFRNRYT